MSARKVVVGELLLLLLDSDEFRHVLKCIDSSVPFLIVYIFYFSSVSESYRFQLLLGGK